MYSVGVREHVMIAHSFRGELFGPAQRLHGATYVVDLELRSEQLDPSGVVVDIARASEVLARALADLRYRNLDELPELRGVNTTTEFLAKLICDRVRTSVADGQLGPGGERVVALAVTLHESHLAWGRYEQALR